MKKKLLPTVENNVININQKLGRKSPKAKVATTRFFQYYENLKYMLWLQEEEKKDILRNNKVISLHDWKKVKGMQPPSSTFPKL